MLVACRLAGLSALGAHYAGVNTLAQLKPMQAPQPCSCSQTSFAPMRSASHWRSSDERLLQCWRTRSDVVKRADKLRRCRRAGRLHQARAVSPHRSNRYCLAYRRLGAAVRAAPQSTRSSPDSRLIRAKNSSSLWAASAMTCSSVLFWRALSRSSVSGPTR
jgi:hypothetical protein